MLYNKKPLFRKLFSKGKSSSKGNNANCRSHPVGNSMHHNNQHKDNSENGVHVPKLADKCLASPDCKDNEQCQEGLHENSSSPAISRKPAPLSGLIAAKLSCDEWGYQRRQPSSPPATVTTKVVVAPQLPISSPLHSKKQNIKSRPVQLRGLKVHHPSYKAPTLQRSHSMKERREAKEKARRSGFTTSLYCIKEVPENGFNW